MSIQRRLARRSNVGNCRRLPADEPEQAMSYTLTAFERSPDRGRGLARDMRVRWALEEVGSRMRSAWRRSMP
jgi:hypothetical protein